MSFKGFVAAAVAVALSATPAIAANNSASALALTPAVETVSGSEQVDGGTWLLIALAAVAAGLGIWALADNGDDAPVSA